MEKLELFKNNRQIRQNVTITAILHIACKRNRGSNAIIAMFKLLLTKGLG